MISGKLRCMVCGSKNTKEIKPGVWECDDCQTQFAPISRFKKDRDKRKYG